MNLSKNQSTIAIGLLAAVAIGLTIYVVVRGNKEHYGCGCSAASAPIVIPSAAPVAQIGPDGQVIEGIVVAPVGPDGQVVEGIVVAPVGPDGMM